MIFVTSILVIALVSGGKWISLEKVARSRSAARPEERTVCVCLRGAWEGGGHNFNTLQPSSLPQLSLKFSERRKKTKKNSTSAADFQSKIQKARLKMTFKKWFKSSSNPITSVKPDFKSLFDLWKWTKSSWKKEKGWTKMSGFATLVAVFTLWQAGEAARRLHQRLENKMNKRTKKTSWCEIYKFDLLQPAEQLDIHASMNHDSLAPSPGDYRNWLKSDLFYFCVRNHE